MGNRIKLCKSWLKIGKKRTASQLHFTAYGAGIGKIFGHASNRYRYITGLFFGKSSSETDLKLDFARLFFFFLSKYYSRSDKVVQLNWANAKGIRFQ